MLRERSKKKIVVMFSLIVLLFSFGVDSASANTVDIDVDELVKEAEQTQEDAMKAQGNMIGGDFKPTKGVEPKEIRDVHESLEPILHIDSGLFYQDIGRSFLWGTTKMLVWMNDSVEKGVEGILTLGHFYEHSSVKNAIKKLTPFAFGLFLVALIYLGIQFMLNKVEKRDEILLNVLLASTMIILVPIMLPYLNSVLQVGLSSLDEVEDGTNSLAKNIVKMNVADVEQYVERGFNLDTGGDYGGDEGGKLPLPANKETGKGTTNYTNANEIVGLMLTPTEKIDIQGGRWKKSDYAKDLKDAGKDLEHDVLLSRTYWTGYENKSELMGLRDNVVPATSIGQESYYRYHFNWGTIIFTLFITMIALAVTIIKMGRVMFDIGFHSIFAMFVSATDLTGGQRTKKMMTEIVSSFAVLFVMVLIMKLFVYYTNWVSGLNVSPIISLLLLISGAWALMDAPDIVQRILGIDAGLRSGYQAMMGAYAGSKLAGGAVRGAGKVAGGTAKGIGGGMAFAQGFASGGSGESPKAMPKSSSKKENNSIPIVKGSGDDNPPPPPNGGGGGSDDNKPPNGGGGGGSDDTPSLNGGDNSGDAQPSMPSEGSYDNSTPSIPTGIDSSQGQESNYIPEGHGNPYQSQGIIGGSRSGQERANFKARSFNSGVNARKKMGNVAQGTKKGVMAGARFVRSPIKSARNIGAMATAKAMMVNSSVSQGASQFKDDVVSKASQVASDINTPIGESIATPISSTNGASIPSASSSSGGSPSGSVSGSNTSESRTVRGSAPVGSEVKGARRSTHTVNTTYATNPSATRRTTIDEVDIVEKSKTSPVGKPNLRENQRFNVNRKFDRSNIGSREGVDRRK